MSLLGSNFEAAAFVLLVPLARAVAASNNSYRGSFGPAHVDVSTGWLAALAAAAVLSAAVVNVVISWQSAGLMSTWERRKRDSILHDYLSADHATQVADREGTLASLNAYAGAGSAALSSIAGGIKAALNITIFAAIAITLDYRAAVAMLGASVLLSLCLRPAVQRSKAYSRQMASLQLEYGRELFEASRMAPEVRVFSAAEALRHRLGRISERIAAVRRRAAIVGGIASPAYQYLGLLLIVSALVVARGLGPADVTAFGAIALLLLRSISFGQQLQGSYQSIVANLPFIDKLEEMRATYIDNAAQDGTIVLEAVHQVDLQDVSYSYDSRVDALSGISTSFRRGEIVGIVGPSGSGKSTLSQLLLRLRRPTAGAVLVNGTPAVDYTLASWYRHVSLVPQEPRLLHGTVVENIAFLDPTVSRDDVVAAAKATGVHDVIESLDDGYDTLIGPSFRDLSGGQIQRVGIARALARGADVLVLDEPTSSLDVHSEGVIQATLEGLRARALVIVIAHRLSTLSICDRLVVLGGGRLEVTGPLAAVAERSEFFSRALEAGTLDIGAVERPPFPPLDDG